MDLAKLNDVMEFDHVIRVDRDGNVTDGPSEYFELTDGNLDGPKGWSLMRGYSGQYMYSGPVMHDSEFIGGTMARDILAQPGLYVALVNSYITDDEDGSVLEGWAVAYLPDWD